MRFVFMVYRVNDIIEVPSLSAHSVCTSSNVHEVYLPTVLLWHPLKLLGELLQPPTLHVDDDAERSLEKCRYEKCNSLMKLYGWNTGVNDGHMPRCIHDISNVVLLVPATYMCELGHEIISTSPLMLAMFPEQEYIPFILFHKSGVMRNFARTIISLTIDGLSFIAIERFIANQRQQKMSSYNLKVSTLLTLHNDFENQKICFSDLEEIASQKPYPSNDMLGKCFISNFAEHKLSYFCHMSTIGTDDYISIDHTFKVAANIGYLRADSKWVTQYNSLLIVLNHIGQSDNVH